MYLYIFNHLYNLYITYMFESYNGLHFNGVHFHTCHGQKADKDPDGHHSIFTWLLQSLENPWWEDHQPSPHSPCNFTISQIFPHVFLMFSPTFSGLIALQWSSNSRLSEVVSARGSGGLFSPPGTLDAGLPPSCHR